MNEFGQIECGDCETVVRHPDSGASTSLTERVEKPDESFSMTLEDVRVEGDTDLSKEDVLQRAKESHKRRVAKAKEGAKSRRKNIISEFERLGTNVSVEETDEAWVIEADVKDAVVEDGGETEVLSCPDCDCELIKRER